jgi:hypothetical protein
MLRAATFQLQLHLIPVGSWLLENGGRFTLCISVGINIIIMSKIINCNICTKEFLSSKNLLHCSLECKIQSRRKFLKNCERCNTEYKELSLHSYAHERSGATRSKMELYIQENLNKDYPLLEKLYNDKNVIGSELDVYMPSLKLAIELNGIFHYEPIYGLNHLEKIQNRDKQKLITCYEKGIELLIINMGDKGFTKKFAKDVYYQINNLVKSLLGRIKK